MRAALIVLPLLAASAAVASAQEGTKAPKALVELVADPRADEAAFFVGAPMPFAIRLLLVPEAPEATVATSWHQTAKIEVAPEGSKEWKPLATIPMTATRADLANPTARLVPEQRGHAAYLVAPPAETAKLAPGAYRLRARAEVTVTGKDGAPRAETHEASFPFKVAAPATADDAMRVALLQSQFEMETDGTVDRAIAELEKGLAASGRPEMRHHLGWAYVRKGEIAKAIEQFRAYVAWARSSGIPRVKCCGRGVQEVADELDAVIPILEKRLAEEKAK